jgi:hypothetical protein
MEKTVEAKPFIVQRGPTFPSPPVIQLMVRMTMATVHRFKHHAIEGVKWVRYYGHSN